MQRSVLPMTARRARHWLMLGCLMALAAVVFPAAAQQKGYAYTYCHANAYNSAQKSFFVFSAPFQVLPLLVNGQQQHAQVTEKYEAGRQEFKRYLQGRGFRLVENGGPRCNSWPPQTVATHEEALANLKASMDSMVTNMRDFMSAPASATQHTDFLPSFATPLGKTASATPPTTPPAVKPTTSGGGNGIILDSGPTQAERERAQQEEEAATRRNLQREQEHARDIQQRFDTARAQDGQRIRQKVKALHEDYDRRQAACKAGDTANCYAKVSAQ